MPSSLTCPEEAELLAVAAGEEPRDELRMHLSGCPLCRERLGQLNLEIAMFRETAMSAEEPPAALDETGSAADTADAEVHGPDATAAPGEMAEFEAVRPSCL